MTRISKAIALRNAIIMAAAVACGGSGDVVGPAQSASINGNWTGLYAIRAPITMNIAVNSGVLTGTGVFDDVPPRGSAATLSGTFDPPNVTIVMHSFLFKDITFTGSANGNTMTGVLNGNGFANFAMGFTRH